MRIVVVSIVMLVLVVFAAGALIGTIHAVDTNSKPVSVISLSFLVIAMVVGLVVLGLAVWTR